MRHRVSGKHLSRTSSHRTALRRNLASSLFEHGTISTTREKAKYVKPFAEKLITLAKDGSLHARRRAIALLQDRNICTVENGEPVKQDTVIGKLFRDIGPRFSDRNGGYTRIIKLPLRRVGDNGQLVLLQLVDEKVTSKVKPSSATVKTKSESPSENPEIETVEDSVDSPVDSDQSNTNPDDSKDKDASE